VLDAELGSTDPTAGDALDPGACELEVAFVLPLEAGSTTPEAAAPCAEVEFVLVDADDDEDELDVCEELEEEPEEDDALLEVALDALEAPTAEELAELFIELNADELDELGADDELADPDATEGVIPPTPGCEDPSEQALPAGELPIVGESE